MDGPRYGTIAPVDVVAASGVAAAAQGAEPAVQEDRSENRAVLPEWADPDHPEIDYTKGIFSALLDQGYQIRGWWAFKES